MTTPIIDLTTLPTHREPPHPLENLLSYLVVLLLGALLGFALCRHSNIIPVEHGHGVEARP